MSSFPLEGPSGANLEDSTKWKSFTDTMRVLVNELQVRGLPNLHFVFVRMWSLLVWMVVRCKTDGTATHWGAKIGTDFSVTTGVFGVLVSKIQDLQVFLQTKVSTESSVSIEKEVLEFCLFLFIFMVIVMLSL